MANVSFSVFTVYTTDEYSENVIDSLEASVMVTKAAPLMGTSFQVAPTQVDDVGIVQERNQMRLSFSSPVPLKEGCAVSYWFPTAFFNADLIESVRTGALFSLTSETFYSEKSGRSSKVFTVKEEADGYKSVNFKTCPVFRSQEAPETSLIVGLRLPTSTQESLSVRVLIYDSRGTLVTYADHGLSFAATAGSLSIEEAIHSPTVVSSLSYFTWTIKTSHSLSQADNPTVKI